MHERASFLAMIGAGVTIGLAWLLSGPLGLMGIALATTSVQFMVGILVVPQFYTFMRKKMELTGYSLSLFSVKQVTSIPAFGLYIPDHQWEIYRHKLQIQSLVCT